MLLRNSGYPGPHGLGLIEGPPASRTPGAAWTGIPGRMAWASLKVGAYLAGIGASGAYPGPHGLGLIEGG